MGVEEAYYYEQVAVAVAFHVVVVRVVVLTVIVVVAWEAPLIVEALTDLRILLVVMG